MPGARRDIRAARKQAMRPASPTDWWPRQCPDGLRLNLSDEAQLAIEQLDELRRMRRRAELESAAHRHCCRPVLDVINDDSDEAGSIVRTIEGLHGNGWAGRALDSDQQLADAQRLQRAIHIARELRVRKNLTPRPGPSSRSPDW